MSNFDRKSQTSLRVTYSRKGCLNQRAANTVQWFHHSFALIHANNWQTKKHRPEMSIWYRITLLLNRNSYLTFKLLTTCSSLNESFAFIAPQFNNQPRSLSRYNEIHMGHFKTTTICFNLKDAIWSLRRRKKTRKKKKKGLQNHSLNSGNDRKFENFLAWHKNWSLMLRINEMTLPRPQSGWKWKRTDFPRWFFIRS